MTPEWAETFVDDLLDWSFLSFDDLPELAELRAAMEYYDDPLQTMSYDDLVADWNRPGAHASHHAVVGREKSGRIVAYGWNHPDLSDRSLPRVWFDVGVHPAWRHQGIRHNLSLWLIARAEQWYLHIHDEQTGPLWVGSLVDKKRIGLTDSIVSAGLAPERWQFDMHRDLVGTELPELVVPPEVTIVPFEEKYSEQARAAHNEAFASRPGARETSREDWERSLNSEGARARLSWLAIVNRPEPSHTDAPHGRVVGYAINRAYEDEVAEGWTERIGVCPECHGKGIGRALMITSMRGFVEAGLESAGIGVDTVVPQVAEDYFTSMGFVATERLIVYGRTSSHEELLAKRAG
ncbi:GNAT family N-acetyltransferase [Propionibacterium australiense]|uniref:Acetyltransferase (GNAT) domain n=1 Tax=Propionibacterium australiense TaxID=119981 RepID=A0A383S4A4_9ACTN|nr:GNAT family N-acetyltransferase [Propionibacterium australiense]RLP11499.1 GNAT family N-acetyltransferase [Propionibacterium australiense]RLP12765.1 GNAT family N-acetyltransferase [Propionibacterium australiense]SYZ32204.1 Acetyltransferase (GNAT) domain [Propionibacterium australiense]VEH90687.1 mycothiol synthase [Propionibacterium australiense]